MLTAGRLLILTALVLTGCRTAKQAAVTTFRVIDAPARYVRDRIDPPDQQTTTTTTTTSVPTGQSDVVTPGRPVTATTPRPSTTTSHTSSTSRAATTSHAAATPRPSPRATPRRETATSSSTPRSTPAVTRATASAPPTEYPTARPVPGKPGFVYSIDPNGGMVDVTGYKSGDKAKDPYTHQVFIVP